MVSSPVDRIGTLLEPVEVTVAVLMGGAIETFDR